MSRMREKGVVGFSEPGGLGERVDAEEEEEVSEDDGGAGKTHARKRQRR